RLVGSSVEDRLGLGLERVVQLGRFVDNGADGIERVLIAGEPDALTESFAGEPEVYDPVRGRVKGVRGFSDVLASAASVSLRCETVWGQG
ncbi:MAG: hypothetical protein ABI438_01625, partial [Dermatophilaceae bacterium]